VYWDEVAELPKGQMNDVFRLVVAEEVFNANLVYAEVDWFYHLGLQKYYFQRFSPKDIAKHIHSFIAGKKLAATTGNAEDIWIEHHQKFPDGTPQSSLHMSPTDHPKMVRTVSCRSAPPDGSSHCACCHLSTFCPAVLCLALLPAAVQVHIEGRLQGKIAKIPNTRPYTLEFFLSENTIVPFGKKKLGLYVLQTSEWANPAKLGSAETSIWDVASELFLRDKTKAIRDR
jgi:hypothetical protein